MTTGSMSVTPALAAQASQPRGDGGFEGVGRAHGKVILTGEHAVVYGQPAIAVPLSGVELTATVRADGRGMLTSSPFRGSIEDAPASLEPVVTALRGTADLIGMPVAGLSLTIDGDVPMGRGLGSSAAVATAVVRSVVDLGAHRGLRVPDAADSPLADGAPTADPGGRGPADRALHALVQQSEAIAHGRSSGLDPYAVAADGPILYSGSRPTPLRLAADLGLVVADSGSHGSTAQAVGGVRTLMADDPLPTRARIEALGQITEHAVQILAGRGTRAELGHELNRAHVLLQELGVSTPELDSLAAAAVEAGADGAKLTGSGLGGCVVALVNSAESAHAVGKALTTAGAARVWTSILAATPDGSRESRQEEAS